MTSPDLALPLPEATPNAPPPPNPLTVEMLPVWAISPYPGNPRINEHVVDELARLIAEIGWRQPIVVDNDRTIVVGHTRYLAALKLNLQHVPVHVAADLTPQQAKAYRIADNKVGERAEWDYGALQAELKDLLADQYDLLGTGFRQFEIDPIMQADWAPPEVEGTLGATGGRDEGPLLQADFDWAPRFSDRSDFEAVVSAVRRYRAKANAPEACFEEAVVKICRLYRPTK